MTRRPASRPPAGHCDAGDQHPTVDKDDRYGILLETRSKGSQTWAVMLSSRARHVHMTFPHRKYGGVEAALVVARACRDAALRETAAMTHRQIRTQVRRNRSEGVPGVYYAAAGGRRSASWRAQTRLPNGRVLVCSFSVSRYGDATARRLAEAERRRMLDDIENIDAAALRSPVAILLEGRLGTTSSIKPLRPEIDGIERGVSRQGAPLWRAALHRGGRWIRCNFADAMFGGQDPAQAVAFAWCEAVLAVVPAQVTRWRPSKSSVPGGHAMPGVHFVATKGVRAARWYARAVARDGRVERRSFSVARHGDVGARRLAEAERLRMLRDIEEQTPPKPS